MPVNDKPNVDIFPQPGVVVQALNSVALAHSKLHQADVVLVFAAALVRAVSAVCSAITVLPVVVTPAVKTG